MTLRLADGRTTFLDFREKAPLAATAGMLQDAHGQVVSGRSTDSWLAVGVPGSVMGFETARVRYGTMSRSALMAPAIKLAKDGFVLGQGDAGVMALETAGLARDPAAARIFLPKGRPWPRATGWCRPTSPERWPGPAGMDRTRCTAARRRRDRGRQRRGWRADHPERLRAVSGPGAETD